MRNKRNYYRILQVQADAPFEIIRTSYRTLMRELKQHPDLGGDNWTASIINEAFEILSDSVRRAEYDRELLSEYTIKAVPNGNSKKKPLYGISCPVCNAVHARHAHNEMDCSVSGSFKATWNASPFSSCRRSVNRIKTNGKLTFCVSRSLIGRGARVLDISPNGIRFKCSKDLRTNETILLRSSVLRAEARVISSKKNLLNGTTCYYIGAQFTNVTFNSARGSFYSGWA